MIWGLTYRKWFFHRRGHDATRIIDLTIDMKRMAFSNGNLAGERGSVAQYEMGRVARGSYDFLTHDIRPYYIPFARLKVVGGLTVVAFQLDEISKRLLGRFDHLVILIPLAFDVIDGFTQHAKGGFTIDEGNTLAG